MTLLERVMLGAVTALDLVREVAEGRASARSHVEAALARAKTAQRALNAFITIAGAQALARADAVDAALRSGATLPLAGLPIVVKDNLLAQGLVTTAGSRSLADFVAPYTATVVERLEAAGAVVIAKSNMDEFAMGSSNEHSAFGPVRNPWDLERIPGGSSGGSAAAVSAGVTPVALGTDTGGSVRQPASFCGLIGFKPTYGRLSRYGVIAFASSLDQVGVLCHDAGDLALVMDVMGGHDPRDATSIVGDEPGFQQAATNVGALDGLRIGIVDELTGNGNSAMVRSCVDGFAGKLAELGARVERVSLPHSRYGLASYYLVAPAEASANLARYDGMIYSLRQGEPRQGQSEAMRASRAAGFGKEVKRRIVMGTYVLSSGYYQAYYEQGLKVRRLIAGDFEKAFDRVDVLLCPTAPTVAYRLGEKAEDPVAMYRSDVDTVLASLAGLPAISLPAGFAEDGMPCGAQLIAPAMADERLVRIAAALAVNVGEAPRRVPPHGEANL